MKTSIPTTDDGSPHSIHFPLIKKTGIDIPDELCPIQPPSWANELLAALKDSILVKIARELIAGLSPETVRKHCKLKMQEWRHQMTRLRRAIHALWNGDGDLVTTV